MSQKASYCFCVTPPYFLKPAERDDKNEKTFGLILLFSLSELIRSNILGSDMRDTATFL